MDSDIFEVLKVGGSVDIQRTDGKRQYFHYLTGFESQNKTSKLTDGSYVSHIIFQGQGLSWFSFIIIYDS